MAIHMPIAMLQDAGDVEAPESDFMKAFKVAEFDYEEEAEEAPAGGSTFHSYFMSFLSTGFSSCCAQAIVLPANEVLAFELLLLVHVWKAQCPPQAPQPLCSVHGFAFHVAWCLEGPVSMRLWSFRSCGGWRSGRRRGCHGS